MLKDLSVLIPYKPDGGPRDEALVFVQKFYKYIMPYVEVCVGEIPGGEPFSRSRAINLAAAKAKGNVLIIADGDIIYDPDLIVESMDLIDQGHWVIPFSRINRLSRDCSLTITQGKPEWPLKGELDTKEEHAAYFVGGLNILSRDAFERVGGYDERFIGWGGEDEAFAYSLDTLVGKHTRLNGLMLHFWHPFVGPAGNPHYEDNYQLFEQYKAALGDIDEMSSLISEKKSFDSY